MPLDILLSTVMARLGASGKALLVLGAALLMVGVVFAWFWLQERKSMRVYRKRPSESNSAPQAGPQRTPGLSLAEEKRRHEGEEQG